MADKVLEEGRAVQNELRRLRHLPSGLVRHNRRHLYVCGKRCNFGSDDFLFPSLFAIAVRLTWLSLAIAVCVFINVQPDCDDPHVPPILQGATGGFVLLHLVMLACEFLIVFFAVRGSLSNSTPRRKITYVLLIRAILYAVEIGWAAFCTYVVMDEAVAKEIDCDSFRQAVFLFVVMVYTYWFLLATIALLFLGFLDPCGCCCVSGLIKNLHFYNGTKNLEIRLFNNRVDCTLMMSRFRALCCCHRRNGLNGSKRLAIADVTRALGVIFSDFDATFSDKIAGMLLAYHYQRRLVQANLNPTAELKKATVTLLIQSGAVAMGYEPPLPTPLTDSELPGLLLHYYKFALATYGWPIGVYMNPCKGSLDLCIKARGCCCCPCFQGDRRLEGDSCFPNSASISHMAGVKPIDGCFVNKVHTCPFYVASDGERREVIVAMRGTLSLKDLLTDVSVSMTDVGSLLGIEKCWIHSGVLEAAEDIQEKLEKSEPFKDLVAKGYRVVLVGHSLGAGVAAALAVLLKDRRPDWSHGLKAYCYSAPGAVFSYFLAKRSEEFVTSIVGGHDLVPRMTMRSLGYLKLLVQQLLNTVDISKHKVLCCGGFNCWTQRVNLPPSCEKENICNLIPSEGGEEGEGERLQNGKTKEEGEEGGNEETDNSALGKLQMYLPWTIRGWRKEKRKSTQHSVSQFVSRLNMALKWKGVVRREAMREEEGVREEGVRKEEGVRGEERVKEEERVREEEGVREEEDEQGPLMFVPGRVLHIEETAEYTEKRCLRKERRVKASWKAQEDFSAILVHRDMLMDHNPSRTHTLLTLLQKQVGVEPVALETVTLADSTTNGTHDAGEVATSL